MFSGLQGLWIPAVAGMTVMGGCGRPEKEPGSEIACAIGGAEAFTRDCTLERAESADGTILTVHHPDGGFRRLFVLKDGHGVAAADGAETAEARMSGQGEIEVSLAGDRYRLPAKAKPAP